MNTRAWTIAGYAAGALAVALLIVLATLAFATNTAMTPRYALGCIVDMMLGTAAIKLLASARTVEAIEERSASYVHGVSDTVDRLAEALPNNVRRIG